MVSRLWPVARALSTTYAGRIPSTPLPSARYGPYCDLKSTTAVYWSSSVHLITWSHPAVDASGVGLGLPSAPYASQWNAKVSHTSCELNVPPSSHVTSWRRCHVTHIAAAVSAQWLVCTSPLATVGTCVARSGLQ